MQEKNMISQVQRLFDLPLILARPAWGGSEYGTSHRKSLVILSSSIKKNSIVFSSKWPYFRQGSKFRDEGKKSFGIFMTYITEISAGLVVYMI